MATSLEETLISVWQPALVEDAKTVVLESQSYIVRRTNRSLATNLESGECPFIVSRTNDNWEMSIEGPKGFERSYTLAGSAGEHQPIVIGSLLLGLLPLNRPQPQKLMVCVVGLIRPPAIRSVLKLKRVWYNE